MWKVKTGNLVGLRNQSTAECSLMFNVHVQLERCTAVRAIYILKGCTELARFTLGEYVCFFGCTYRDFKLRSDEFSFLACKLFERKRLREFT